ncbi:hypothetical protein AB0O67_02675 [Streptomyces sp. NPDC086077]|uniref:hypothetical protein n=1 Tax=Streptomyces sp. NPDC086077 TaxID=3154862 RepID=UPI0034346075
MIHRVVPHRKDVRGLFEHLDPACDGDTYRGLRAAQALVRRAVEPRDALAPMHRRGESELPARILARALRVLDGERRAARVPVAPRSDSCGKG